MILKTIPYAIQVVVQLLKPNFLNIHMSNKNDYEIYRE